MQHYPLQHSNILIKIPHSDWLILDFGRATLGAKGRRVRVFTKNSPNKVLYVGGQYQKCYKAVVMYFSVI